MEVLTEEMIIKSFTKGNEFGDEFAKYDGRRLFFNHSETATFAIATPKKVCELPRYVRSLATLGYEEQYFVGAKIWFTDFGIWNEIEEGVGYQLLEAINAASGQAMPFEFAQGYRFRADELVKTLGVLMQPIIFGWDAYYLPQARYCDYFLQAHHHECVFITTKTRKDHDTAIQYLVNCRIEFLSGKEPGMISRYLSKSDLLTLEEQVRQNKK